jgi:hypothetical protein
MAAATTYPATSYLRVKGKALFTPEHTIVFNAENAAAWFPA